MLSLIIGFLMTVVIGAILFWAINKYCRDARLAKLLRLLVVLVSPAVIVNRLSPLIAI